MENRSQSELEVLFWPFKLSARGDRAIAAVRWPLAVIMIAVAAAVLVKAAMELKLWSAKL